MKRFLGVVLLALTLALGFPTAAFAQSGHFVGTPTCEDIGTQVVCTGKVAGLGGTTFEITVDVDGATAIVECTNPAGNVAPGQSFTFDPEGTTGERPTTRNGQFRFNVATAAPEAPDDACPNPKWDATVTDVEFSGDATVTLLEDDVPSDTVRVPIG